MKPYIFILLLAVSQTLGEDDVDQKAEALKSEVLKKLISENDTPVEAEAKDVIAEYLVASVLEDNGLPVPFASRNREREKERQKERQKEREEREKERQRQREKNRNRNKPGITDFRDIPTQAPVVVNIINNPSGISNSNPVRVDPGINNAGLNPAAAASDTQTKIVNVDQIAKEATQVPVIIPGANGQPTVPPAAAATAPPANPAVATNAPAVTAAPVETTTITRRTRPTVDPNHVYQQVDKILGSVATGNIVGIVDNSLAIRAPQPVRNFVTGILKVIFCNPVDRIFGRCRPDSTGQISSVQGR